jgi:hypothetical protein
MMGALAASPVAVRGPTITAMRPTGWEHARVPGELPGSQGWAAMGRRVLLGRSAAMATHEHRPTTAPSEDGNSGPPSGWYPDP